MYSIIDIESNGGGFRKECIIDIAIYKFDGHQIIDQFISLVNPEADITPFVQKLTGITPKMVKTAPKFHEIAKRVVEITEGTTLVGHNIEFDYRMLRQSFQKLGYKFIINTLDTINLSKKLIPNAESYSLGKLTKSLGIPLSDHHRASGDARATLDLFKLLMNKDSDNEIIQQQYEETNTKTYINKIKELTQDLPSEQGIVYLQNRKGKILLLDFVDNINRFAKKILNSKSKKIAHIQNDIEQIHYDLIGNHLVAKLMMKSNDIKKKESLPFGLFYHNDNFFITKTTNHKQERPLVKFKSYTQGAKALAFIKSNDKINDIEQLKSLLNLKTKDGIWTTNGRVLGEKTFIKIQNGLITSYGFYELYNQIATAENIKRLEIPIKTTPTLANELKLAFLKGEIKKEIDL